MYFDLMFIGLTALLFDHFLGNLDDVIGEEFEVNAVMDNAPAHAREQMEFDGHHIVYLLPHLPMLNQIKMAFSTKRAVVKRKLIKQMTEIFDRQAADAAANFTLTAYLKNIVKCIVKNVLLDGKTITPEKCGNSHQHAFQYMPACIARDEFLM